MGTLSNKQFSSSSSSSSFETLETLDYYAFERHIQMIKSNVCAEWMFEEVRLPSDVIVTAVYTENN